MKFICGSLNKEVEMILFGIFLPIFIISAIGYFAHDYFIQLFQYVGNMNPIKQALIYCCMIIFVVCELFSILERSKEE